MKTTGNAGGSHNLVMTSRLTQASDNLDAMLQKLGTGLKLCAFVTQGCKLLRTLGQGGCTLRPGQ
jgi:PmbA protein